MDYFSHYEKLIDRARNRVLDGYSEKHHAVPRCMGGSDSKANIVLLTPEEHYVAHQLLIKMYPSNRRLAHAANMMATRCSNNKTFGWIRKHLGFNFSAEHRAKLSAKLKGRIFTPEWKAKLSASKTGKKSNRIATQEQRDRLAERNRTWVWTDEARQKIRAYRTGRKMGPRSPETILKMVAASTGRKHTPEAIAKLVAISARRIRDKSGHIIGLREET